jgi:hypothetical protein
LADAVGVLSQFVLIPAELRGSASAKADPTELDEACALSTFGADAGYISNDAVSAPRTLVVAVLQCPPPIANELVACERKKGSRHHAFGDDGDTNFIVGE